MSIDPEKSPDLIFEPELVLAPSKPKPTNKVLRVLDEHIPGLFDASEIDCGVQTVSVHFAGGAIEGMPSSTTTYLHARGTTDIPKIAETDGFSIASGICLFGEAGVQSYGTDGEPTVLDRPGVSASDDMPKVADIKRNNTQLYVPESIARLGRTMIALAKVARVEYNKAVKMSIHLPGPEYKLFAEAAYVSRKVTIEALHQYYELVDAEVEDIKSEFTKLFEKFSVQPPVYYSPLDVVTESLEPGSLNIDHFQNTPFEPTAIDKQSMQEVEHASEIEAYLHAAKNGSLPVFVDNHAQEKIFKAAKTVPGFRGVALYPLPMCVSKKTKNLLYHEGANEQEIALAVTPWVQE